MTSPIEDSGWIHNQQGRCYVVGTRTVKFSSEVIDEYIGCWVRKQLALTYGQEQWYKLTKSEDGKSINMRFAIDSGD